MSKSKKNEESNPTIFGIAISEENSTTSKQGQLFGISIAPVDNSSSTSYYQTPAITQSLNLLEMTLKKTEFDKSDFETLRSTLSLLPISEISRLRSTISVASLDNLVKKADIYEKSQSNEIEKKTSLNQNQNIESPKLLSQEEINKLMANFLNERNDLEKNMEEKNKQISLENNKQNNPSN